MRSMDAKARRALAQIQDCVAADRYLVLPHFRKRMARRGLVWPDMLAVLDDPEGVRLDGNDDWDRPKWIVKGTATDGQGIELVCVLAVGDDGDITVFITVYRGRAV